jgi:hypothetical protein
MVVAPTVVAAGDAVLEHPAIARNAVPSHATEWRLTTPPLSTDAARIIVVVNPIDIEAKLRAFGHLR